MSIWMILMFAALLSLVVLLALWCRHLRRKISGIDQDRALFDHVMRCTGGGIHRRLQKNRELLGLLRQEEPQLLLRTGWVSRYLDEMDDFLLELAKLSRHEQRRRLGHIPATLRSEFGQSTTNDFATTRVVSLLCYAQRRSSTHPQR